MKNRNNNLISKISFIAFLAGYVSLSSASTISIADKKYIINAYNSSLTAIVPFAPTYGNNGDFLTAVFGTWSSNQFTPFYTAALTSTSSQNLGYGYAEVGNGTTFSEGLSVSLNQSSSTTGLNIAAETQVALAIFNKADTTYTAWKDYSGSVKAVLTDVSWTVPAWTLTGNDKTFAFTSSTQALMGEFTYSLTGYDTITLIPEPSSASLLALGVAGLVALRIRRKS